jgi:hypothetical protein
MYAQKGQLPASREIPKGTIPPTLSDCQRARSLLATAWFDQTNGARTSPACNPATGSVDSIDPRTAYSTLSNIIPRAK